MRSLLGKKCWSSTVFHFDMESVEICLAKQTVGNTYGRKIIELNDDDVRWRIPVGKMAELGICGMKLKVRKYVFYIYIESLAG